MGQPGPQCRAEETLVLGENEDYLKRVEPFFVEEGENEQNLNLQN